jgi:ACR3 family arsenite efflux pump ArsB
MNQDKIELRKVRDFGGLLNVTFDFIKQNFKLLFKSNLLIAAPFILLAGVFMGIYQSSLFNFSTNPDLEKIGIPFLFAMLFMMLSYLVITIVTYSPYAKTPI